MYFDHTHPSLLYHNCVHHFALETQQMHLELPIYSGMLALSAKYNPALNELILSISEATNCPQSLG